MIYGGMAHHVIFLNFSQLFQNMEPMYLCTPKENIVVSCIQLVHHGLAHIYIS